MDVKQQGPQKWVPAKECLNYEKRYPVSFSLNGKIYALDTLYLFSMPMRKFPDAETADASDNVCRFEVLDTVTSVSSWRPLCRPPHPFGICSVRGSWISHGSDDCESRLFIEALGSRGANYLFVYDVGGNTWAKFDLDHIHGQVSDKYFLKNGFIADYSWSLHLVGTDYAPFPPYEPYTGNLRAFTGLDHSISQLEQRVPSEIMGGKLVPSTAHVVMDQEKRLRVPCRNFDIKFMTGKEFEFLWTIHCLPVDNLLFWQVIHLGGTMFCTVGFYMFDCCPVHSHVHARVATFDMTDSVQEVDDDGTSRRLAAKYIDNKVYLVAKSIEVSLLPCNHLSGI